MEELRNNTIIARPESDANRFNYEGQSIYKPFVSSRKLEKSKFNPYATDETLPGIEIPDKPQNVPRAGENCGQGFVRRAEPRQKTVQMNSHEPSQWIPMGERVLSIHPVHHELGSEVVGVRFENRIEIHALRLRTVKNDEFFTMQKIQQLVTEEEECICTMAVGFNSNIGIGTRVLTYAFALHDRSTVFYVKDEPESILPFQASLTIADTNYVKCFDKHSASIEALAFDGENGKYLASLGSESVCKFWVVETGKLHKSLVLDSEGVAVRFHRSEPDKVMVAERSGWIKTYNLKNLAVVSAVFCSTTPLLTVEWANCDPTTAAAGVMNKVLLYRQIDRNCELARTVEPHGQNTMIRFCPNNRFLFATVNKFKHHLRMFHTQMQAPLWIQLEKEIQWIEWVYGKPFLMACVGENIEFYEATVY